MFQGLFSQFHIESTGQLRTIMERFGQFLSPENRELISAIINEVEKGDNMDKQALGMAVNYLSGGIESGEQSLQGQLGEENYAQAKAAVLQNTSDFPALQAWNKRQTEEGLHKVSDDEQAAYGLYSGEETEAYDEAYDEAYAEEYSEEDEAYDNSTPCYLEEEGYMPEDE